MKMIFEKIFCVGIAFAMLAQSLIVSAAFENDWQKMSDEINEVRNDNFVYYDTSYDTSKYGWAEKATISEGNGAVAKNSTLTYAKGLESESPYTISGIVSTTSTTLNLEILATKSYRFRMYFADDLYFQFGLGDDIDKRTGLISTKSGSAAEIIAIEDSAENAQIVEPFSHIIDFEFTIADDVLTVKAGTASLSSSAASSYVTRTYDISGYTINQFKMQGSENADYFKKIKLIKSDVISVVSDNIVTLNSGNSIEVVDELLYQYTLRAENLSSNTYVSFGKEFNFYNIQQRFDDDTLWQEGETPAFTFMVSTDYIHQGLYLYNGSTQQKYVKFSELLQAPWELQLTDKTYVISAASDADYITVTVSEPTEEVVIDPYIDAVYDPSLCRLTVDMYLPSNKGEAVNFYVFDKETSSKLAYIEQGIIDNQGALVKNFKFMENIADYKLVIVFGYTKYEINDISILNSGAIQHVTLSAEIKDGNLVTTLVGNEAFYGVNEACRIVNAYYKENDILIGITISDSWQDVLSETIPPETVRIKSFAINSIDELIPYTPYQALNVQQ